MSVPIRPAVAAIPSYRAGRPAPLGPGGVSYKLSSNENPHPPLPGVLQAAAEAAERMNRYPDMANTELTAALAARLNRSEDEIALGTGSVGVLYNLLQAVATEGDEIIYPWRSFEAYPIAVQLTGATGVRVPLGPGATHDLDGLAAAVTPDTRAILICTPNNPTGPVVDHDELASFIADVDDHIMIIIDEAYLEFTTAVGAARGLELQRRHPNVVVLRTFSKAYGLAGFRVGYAVATPELAGAVRSCAVPFGVSVVAQAAAVASLRAEEELLQRVRDLVVERDALAAGLRDLGFDVPDAQGNFVWLPAGDRTEAWADTFASAGLMTRAFADGTPGAGLRISVGESAANRLLLQTAATLRSI
jgi:histidinol-phosphate aminotransferase